MNRTRAFTLLISSVFTAALFAQSTGGISGTVFSSQGAVVGDATVTLVELRRATKSAADGTFRFDNIRPGHYHISVESPREGSATGDVEVTAGQTRTVEIMVD